MNRRLIFVLCRWDCSQRLPVPGLIFLAFPCVRRLVKATEVTERTNTATKFHPLSLFSLLVAVKLKPKIVSQGELIVNLRRNCHVLFTTRQTSKHLILALLTILQYSVRVPCARAVTCNTCYSWWAHEMLWVIKVESLRWHSLLICFVRCYRWIYSWPLNLITALNNNSFWIQLSYDVKLEKARLLYDYMFEQLRPEFLSIFLSYLNLVINPSGVEITKALTCKGKHDGFWLMPWRANDLLWEAIKNSQSFLISIILHITQIRQSLIQYYNYYCFNKWLHQSL